MDGIELLREDHDRVRALFERFRSAAEDDDAARMDELRQEIFHELEVHTAIEEEVFYPAVKDVGGEELIEDTDESVEEHHVVDVLMGEIARLDAREAAFKAKMTVLIENVEHHAKEEEEEMFPQVRELMSSEELQSLGRDLDEAKTRYQLSGASKDQLQEKAQDMDIEGRSSMTKEELVDEIQSRSTTE